MRRAVVFACCLTAALALAAQAQAQQYVCAPHEDMEAWLAKYFQEYRVGSGPAGEYGHALYEFYLSENGETWTIVRTRGDGLSCIKTSGDSWLEETPVYGTAL